MSKHALKQIIIAAVVVVLSIGATTSAFAATEENVHAYTTTGSWVKQWFGLGLLILGAAGMATFFTRLMWDRHPRNKSDSSTRRFGSVLY